MPILHQIDPVAVALGPLKIHWYGLMYLLGFGVAWWLGRRRVRAGRLPGLLIDCGTEDFLIESNREFARDLVAAKIPHVYREFPGAHNWDYWDLHIREALEFHARNLRLKLLAV